MMTPAFFAVLRRLAASRRKIGLALLVGLMLLLAACNTTSSGSSSDQVALLRTYRLGAGERLEGDLVVVAEQASLAAQSTVGGDVAMTARRVELNGTIEGDAVIVAEKLTLGPEARLRGDLVACARTFQQAESARIEGDVLEECSGTPNLGMDQLLTDAWLSWQTSWLLRAGSVFLGALFFGALAALGTVLIPRPLACMAETICERPWQAGGVGLLTLAIAGGLTVLYGLSLKLIVPVVFLPVVLLGWLVLGILSLLGWIALAAPLGRWALRTRQRSTHPPMVTAALGGITLGLALRVWNIFWVTGWLTGLLVLGAGSIGLGAVLLTRAGTKASLCGHRAPQSTKQNQAP